MYKYPLQQEAGLFVSWLLSSMKVTTVSIIFLVICCGQSTAQLSTAEKQQALDFHNDLRRSEGASNMQCMVTALCSMPLELYIHMLLRIFVVLDKNSRARAKAKVYVLLLYVANFVESC